MSYLEEYLNHAHQMINKISARAKEKFIVSIAAWTAMRLSDCVPIGKALMLLNGRVSCLSEAALSI